MQVSQLLIDNSLTQMRAVKADMSEQLMQSNSSRIEDIQATAEDFEAVFITQMLQHMFEGIDTDPMFGGGNGEDVFKTFLFDEYGKVMAKSGGLGIAEDIQKSLLQLQEV